MNLAPGCLPGKFVIGVGRMLHFCRGYQGSSDVTSADGCHPTTARPNGGHSWSS